MNFKQLLLLVVLITFLSVQAKDSFNAITVGNVYRMELLNGDTFEGIIKEINDSVATIESKGTPYMRKLSLIHKYKLISSNKKESITTQATSNKPDILTFSVLIDSAKTLNKIRIFIASGKTFEGFINSIDEETVKLDIKGSIIPISKNVITQISTVDPKTTNKKLVPVNHSSNITDNISPQYTQTVNKKEQREVKGEVRETTNYPIEKRKEISWDDTYDCEVDTEIEEKEKRGREGLGFLVNFMNVGISSFHY